MANYLVHGCLHVCIYEADGLVDEERSSGGAPLFFRKVRCMSFSPRSALLSPRGLSGLSITNTMMAESYSFQSIVSVFRLLPRCSQATEAERDVALTD